MSSGLFNSFDKVSAKQWKQKIQADLDGADYNDSLIWKSGDGIDVKPFYHPEEAPEPAPLELPCGWNICEQLYVASAEKTNHTARKLLTRGAESLWFILPNEEIDLQVLFADIPAEIPVYLDCKFLSQDFTSKLVAYFSEKSHRIFLLTDIIGKL